MPIIRIAHRPRYASIPHALLEDKRLSLKAKGLMAYLLSKPDHWTVHLSQLAKISEYDGESSIKSALQELVKAGYAYFEKPRSEQTGRFIDGGWTIYEDASHSHPQGDFPPVDNPPVENPPVASRARVQSSESEILSVMPEREVKTDKSPPLSPQGESAAFKEFYDRYPKKEAREKAWQAWKRLKLDPYQAVIIRAVENHMMHNQKWRDHQYIPMPATFLNQQRWTDDLTPAVLPVQQFSKASMITMLGSMQVMADLARERKAQQDGATGRTQLLSDPEQDE